jgi:chromosome segregation ATPase
MPTKTKTINPDALLADLQKSEVELAGRAASLVTERTRAAAELEGLPGRIGLAAVAVLRDNTKGEDPAELRDRVGELEGRVRQLDEEIAIAERAAREVGGEISQAYIDHLPHFCERAEAVAAGYDARIDELKACVEAARESWGEACQEWGPVVEAARSLGNQVAGVPPTPFQGHFEFGLSDVTTTRPRPRGPTPAGRSLDLAP